MKKLEEIGFYTLSDERAENSSHKSPLKRCELILTDKCNFKCPYCRGLEHKYKKELTLKEAKHIVDLWTSAGLENIRFSGGEPTLWKHLVYLVAYTKALGVNRIALSTNGSSSREMYKSLLKAGVNDFSISFDACCSSTADIMAGRKGIYSTLLDNIKFLAEKTYVTLGVVLTEKNMAELGNIIEVGSSLGVADIRIIPAAQYGKNLPSFCVHTDKPILTYRLKNLWENKSVRGLESKDTHRCPLVLDDMAIAGNYHIPCIIYLREKGAPIGTVDAKSIEEIRLERLEWFNSHDCFKDKICRGNCLDVCVDYNNKWVSKKIKNTYLPKMNSSLFDWLSWRNGNIKDLGISCRYQDIVSTQNIKKLREFAVGWCEGENLPCRPKEDAIAVMFFLNDTHFWFHMRKSEFYEVFVK